MEVILSIDVECIANGCGHLDRTPVSIAVVDSNLKILFDEYMRPDVPVHHYLSTITGITAETLHNARSFSTVRQELLSILGPHVVLVGQGILNDIRWMQVTVRLFTLFYVHFN